jgi:hypothetical protein
MSELNSPSKGSQEEQPDSIMADHLRQSFVSNPTSSRLLDSPDYDKCLAAPSVEEALR